MSVEFGGLSGNNAFSTQQNLLRGILSFFRRGAGDIAGSESNVDLSLLPKKYALHRPYPNPFNPITLISYNLAQTGHVSLIIYDIQGREVVKLVDSIQSAGIYQIVFDGSNLTTGIYFARLQVGDFKQTRKVLLIK
ncbi:T9SS type A sorting domain-containing protein [bacterium]|nr:T9SS type A sorting domain-containing protein [bacterium]